MGLSMLVKLGMIKYFINKTMEIERRKQLVELLKHFDLSLVGVELGVCGGNFSHELLSNGMEKLYSIDLWEQQEGVGDKAYDNTFHYPNYIAAKELLEVFGYKSVIIRKLVADAVHDFPDESLSLVYHDSDHGEAFCKDIEDWWPKLRKGGIFASHDAGNIGYSIMRCSKNFCNKHNLTLHHIPESTINDSGIWFRKPL